MAFAGGDGSESSPYLVSTPAQLQEVRTVTSPANTHFLMTNNIDMTGFGAFTPIGNTVAGFPMVFNGGGYTVSNITVSGQGVFQVVGTSAGASGYVSNLRVTNVAITSTQQAVGVVGYIYAGLIEGCHISGGAITGSRQVGGLVGYVAATATVEQCSATGVTVSGANPYGYQVGGFAGYVVGTIDQCYSSGCTVNNWFDGGNVGGFVGQVYGGTVSNCYSVGSTANRTDEVAITFGGFCGSLTQAGGAITNCYSTGRVTYQAADPTTKGFLGSLSSPAADSGCYWDTQTSLQSTSAGNATGRTTVQMKAQGTFSGWDFVNTWVVNDGVAYPQLQWEISDVEVAFDSQGGVAVDGVTVTYGEAYGTLPVTTRKWYTFLGWYTAPTGGSLITATTIVTRAFAHTLYAQWSQTPPTYTVGPPVSRPGLRAMILNNPDISVPADLKSWALSRLATLQFPSVDYEIEAADLARAGNREHEQIVLGEVGHLVDKDLSINTTVTLQEIHRSLDNPLDVRLMFRSSQRRLDDRVSELAERMDDYGGPTEYMDPENIPIDDDVTLDDWIGPDGTIDGGYLDPESVDLVTLAEVTDYTNTTTETGQTYTVSLLDPATRLPYTPARLLTGCQLSEQLDTPSSIVGDLVVVLRKSDGGESAGAPHLLLLGGTGDETTNNVTNAYYLFWPAYTGLF